MTDQTQIKPKSMDLSLDPWDDIGSKTPEQAKKKVLRPLQAIAIEKVRESLAKHKKVVLKAPTGFGKSLIAASIIQSAVKKGKRVIFVVDAISLLEQTIEKFQEEGIDQIGVIQADHMLTDSSQPVQIASAQTLDRRRNKITKERVFPKTDLVLIDECHCLRKVIIDWMAACPELIFIGLSATPYSKGLGKHFQNVVIPCTTRQLIADGWLSPFRVFAPSHPDLSNVRITAGDYNEADLAKVMDKGTLTADVVTSWRKYGDNRPTLCYAVDRAHAAHLQQDFIAAGITCGYIDAFTTLFERKEIEKKFHSGEIKVVCNVGCLTTGIDWDVRCIILARPTKSRILAVQIVGRGLRNAKGKKDVIIIDHSDTTLKLGFVTDIDEDFDKLDDGAKAAASKQEKKKPVPKECPSCHFLKPVKTPICPACGFKPARASEIETEDGELAEIKKSSKLPEKKIFYSELKYYADIKGYNRGWIAHKYKERFGNWPSGKYVYASAVQTSPETMNWLKSRMIAWAKRK